jgi:3-oxoacyl-[acyl-carrier-protein] synthase-3
MRYENVCFEAVAYTLPEEIVTSEELEARLAPLYSRLRLPEGRLELMTGIRQRRFWPPATMPSRMSVVTAEKAIRQSGIDRRHMGALIHGSVCRDFVEPATAAGVHSRLDLPAECVLFDLSNACLGLLNGVIQVANMIELGQIRAGVVVGTESSRTLVENTIAALNSDMTLTRSTVKSAIASLTIGSGSAAIVLADRQLSRTGNLLLGGVVHANTAFCGLCQSSHDESIAGTSPGMAIPKDAVEIAAPSIEKDASQASEGLLMWTDSERLMREGIHTAQEAFVRFRKTIGWRSDEINKTFCHQVGRAHHKMLFEALGLDPSIDFATFDFLGNTGSVALPMTAAIGIERNCLKPNDHVVLMGIGSGINVVMLGVDWQKNPA